MVSGYWIGRGSVCWYDFGAPFGSTPGKRRPVIVVQSDAYNRSALSTTIVVPLTSQTRYAEFEDNVYVPAAASGLPKDSVALPFQVMTVDKATLGYPVGRVPDSVMRQIDSGLREVLGLTGGNQ